MAMKVLSRSEGGSVKDLKGLPFLMPYLEPRFMP